MKDFKKIAISIRIDGKVLSWFRKRQPKGYQSLIHKVLEEYVTQQYEKETWLAGRAQELFRQYYAQCFWHYDKSLKIHPGNIHIVVEGLRMYGGRKGLLLAEELCQ